MTLSHKAGTFRCHTRVSARLTLSGWIVNTLVQVPGNPWISDQYP
jgi:hypothetical protein